MPIHTEQAISQFDWMTFGYFVHDNVVSGHIWCYSNANIMLLWFDPHSVFFFISEILQQGLRENKLHCLDLFLLVISYIVFVYFKLNKWQSEHKGKWQVQYYVILFKDCVYIYKYYCIIFFNCWFFTNLIVSIYSLSYNIIMCLMSRLIIGDTMDKPILWQIGDCRRTLSNQSIITLTVFYDGYF